MAKGIEIMLANKIILAILYILFIFYSIKYKCFHSGMYEMGYPLFFVYCSMITLFLNIPLIFYIKGFYRKFSCIALWFAILYIAILTEKFDCSIFL